MFNSTMRRISHPDIGKTSHLQLHSRFMKKMRVAMKSAELKNRPHFGKAQ
jgi:hypothetical protein